MLESKEIRIVALSKYLPEGESLEQHIKKIVSEKKPVNIMYDRSNSFDPNCVVAKIGSDAIGLVNKDDIRYVEQLLTKGQAFAKLKFKDLYDDGNSQPILKYSAVIDLEEVPKILPGEDWAKWTYNFPLIKKIDEWDSVDYLADMLTESLVESGDITTETEKIAEELIKAMHFDISVETTKKIENLTFLLEHLPSKGAAELRNRLQRASTGRRSQKTCMEKVPNWYVDLLRSDESTELWYKLSNRIKADKNITTDRIPDEALIDTLSELNANLVQLPYDLNIHIDNIAEIYAKAFYSNIPKDKLRELFSALILREWLRMLLKLQDNIAVTNLFICRDFIVTGGVVKFQDIISDGGTKIVLPQS